MKSDEAPPPARRHGRALYFVVSLLGLALLKFVDAEKLNLPPPLESVLIAAQQRFDRYAWNVMDAAVAGRVKVECLISVSCRKRTKEQPNMTLTAEGTLAETAEAPAQVSSDMALCTMHERVKPAKEIAAACGRALDRSTEGRERAIVYYHLGYARQNMNERVTALETWDQAIDADPTYAPAYVAKADRLLSTNDPATALSLYRQAQQADKLNHDAIVGSARALASLGEHRKALSEFDRALSLNPQAMMANYYLGQYLERHEQFGHAATAYERAGKHFDPATRGAGLGMAAMEHPMIAAARAHHRGGSASKALAAIDTAYPRGAMQGFDLDLRATILEKLGRFSEAADDLKLAIERLPAELEGPLKVRLAFALQRSGQKEEAAKSFEDQLDHGEKGAILRMQVFLRNYGYKEVQITGETDDATRSAVRTCLAEEACSSAMGQNI